MLRFDQLKLAYNKFRFNVVLPFIILISYTLLGAAIFRSLELHRDQNEREVFRKSYSYAFDQVFSFCFSSLVKIFLKRLNELKV